MPSHKARHEIPSVVRFRRDRLKANVSLEIIRKGLRCDVSLLRVFAQGFENNGVQVAPHPSGGPSRFAVACCLREQLFAGLLRVLVEDGLF